MKAYRFLREADAEFHEQIRYFDDQAAGLGDKFVTDVETTVTDVRAHPESGKQVSANVRMRILRVFKHTIFYVNAPDEIIIVAVAPQRRRPGYWRKRLRGLRDARRSNST